MFSAFVADWPQPCSASTRGASDGIPCGTYENISRLPGFDPKLVTCIMVDEACATRSTGSEGDPASTAHAARARAAPARATCCRTDADRCMGDSSGLGGFEQGNFVGFVRQHGRSVGQA